LKRVWDYKEWIVVPNIGLNRSVSPCDMTREVAEEDEVEDIKAAKNREGMAIHDLFYMGHTTVGSPAEIDHARESIPLWSDGTDATIHPNMFSVGHIEEILRHDSSLRYRD
jgi:hypothetical protein